jgi:hypothetical protein
MAPARKPGRRRMGCTRDHSDDPPHQPGKPATPSLIPVPPITAGRLFLAPDDRPPLAGIKVVRPRRGTLNRRHSGCGRSSSTPDRTTAQTGSDEEKPQHQARPLARRPATQSHRVRPARPPDSRGPHGCSYYRTSSPVTALYAMALTWSSDHGPSGPIAAPQRGDRGAWPPRPSARRR